MFIAVALPSIYVLLPDPSSCNWLFLSTEIVFDEICPLELILPDAVIWPSTFIGRDDEIYVVSFFHSPPNPGAIPVA